MLEANRGFVALRHQRDERGAAFIDTTAGWYFTSYSAITPPEAFVALR